MSTFVEVVQTLLADNRVKALLALLGVLALASPLLRFFHDRRELRLRERGVVAAEQQARALLRVARVLERRNRK